MILALHYITPLVSCYCHHVPAEGLHFSALVCLSESAHLAAIALPPHNKLLLLKVADFDPKASLSNKS